MCFFFFKQKTAYEMRISDWSSDVCSSDRTVSCTPPTNAPRGRLMKTAILLSAVGLALVAMAPEAKAAKYKCACETNAKAGVQASTDPKMSCNEDRKSVV